MENFQFEIDNEILSKYKDATKIFISDEKAVLKISKKLKILTIVFSILFIKSIISLFLGARIDVLILLIALIGYSAFYLQKNASKLPLMIIYEDKILFKRQKFFWGKTKLLNAIYLYGSKDFDIIEKKQLKNVVMPESPFRNGEIYFESKFDSSETYIILNVEKEYLNHIFLYLKEYINK